MICKLCKQEKELIKKSHIIPDFIYRAHKLFDENNRIHNFFLSELNNGQFRKLVYSGEYDGSILCKHCDGVIIGQYESYVAPLYNELWQKLLLDDNEGDIIYKMDSTKFYLFYWSIILRACFSIRPFSRYINLCENLEKNICQALFTGNLDSLNDYDINIYSFLNPIGPKNEIILSPFKTIDQFGNDMFILILSGFLIIISMNGFKSNISDNSLIIHNLPRELGENILIQTIQNIL